MRGLCCRRFFIISGLEDLQVRAELEKCGGWNPDEGAGMILDMIETIGPAENGRLPYRCRHFDEVREVCRVYSTRPRMCESCGSSPKDACSFTSCEGPGAPGAVCYKITAPAQDQKVKKVPGPIRKGPGRR